MEEISSWEQFPMRFVCVLLVMSGIAAVFELITSRTNTRGPHPFRLQTNQLIFSSSVASCRGMRHHVFQGHIGCEGRREASLLIICSDLC